MNDAGTSDEAEDDKDDELALTEEELMEKLKALSKCPEGFAQNREGDGWRCKGGSHFVSDEELRRNYMNDPN